MSTATSIYAVDLRPLRAACGSNDADLLQRITDTHRDDIRESNEWHEDAIAAGALTLEAALAELIQGTFSGPPSTAFQYGYALELLCKHLGERVWTDELGEIEGIGFAQALALSGPPIPIPIPEDFPVIGYMTHQQIEAELQRIAGMDLSHPDALVTIAIGQLRAALEEARRQGVDLVAFAS
jgi:hypothetical protein